MPEYYAKEKGPKVLIADDHRATRHMICAILEQEGLTVVEAENGEEALHKYKSALPELVLLDIMMPLMNGLDACTRIKQLPEGNHVPVLIFTGEGEGKTVEMAFQAGAADFITKPINREELRHRVRRLLYLRELELKREAAELKLKSSYEEMQSLSVKVLHAYEEERSRLAKELHDELGMAMTTVKLDLQLLKKGLVDTGIKLGESLGYSIQLVDESLAIIRSKTAFIRPPALDDMGLIAVIQNMAKKLDQSTGMRTTVNTTGEELVLPVEVETAIFRCIQESLTNVARHSSAENIVIDLNWNNKGVSVKITDDGIGFDVEAASKSTEHQGLQGMRERVALLGGMIELKSSPGSGTEIHITIPLERW